MHRKENGFILQRSILITGCSSGIGEASAHYLREKGWRVFASCRQEADCERLRKAGFESPLIDYAAPETIESGLGEVLNATGGTLDAVFNNGAFAAPGLIEDLPREALREIFETNFFGVHDLTRAVIPVMRAQGHGRIVQCSSVLGLVGARTRAAYVATKYAMEGHADVLRLELGRDPIEVVLIEPGPIHSKIRVNAQPYFEKWINWKASAKRGYYEKVVIPRLFKTDGKKDKYELPAEAVAIKLEKALDAKSPKTRYYVTTPTYFAAWAKRLLSDKMLDKILMKG